jgi:hypothetical protein
MCAHKGWQLSHWQIEDSHIAHLLLSDRVHVSLQARDAMLGANGAGRGCERW